MSTTGMIIDGIAASEAIDSSGEILSVEGCDISDLEEGRGVLNYEHRGDDAAGASANDIIGKIIFAKKIFKRTDCSNDREKMYWDKVKLPFIYIKSRLFDGSGHPGAVAAAALIRDYVNNNEPILARYSIEGSTLEKEGNLLKRSIARRVAYTCKPCNKSCHSGLLADPNSPVGDKKEVDLLENVEKAEFQHPSYMRLGGAGEYECDPWVRDAQAIDDVKKTLIAGSYDVAPSHLSGGAALQVEDPERQRKRILEMHKNDVKAAIRDWDGIEDLRRFLKHRLPETDPNFIDRFAELVEDYRLKKGQSLSKAQPSKKVKAPTVAPPLKELQDHKNLTNLPKIAGPDGASAPAQYKPADIRKPIPADLGATTVTDKVNGKPVKVQKKIVVGSAHKHLAMHIPGPRETPKSAADSYFDEETGHLHTPNGSFKMHIPSDAEYQKILNDPTITKHHDEAVKQWKTLHKLLKTGKLPQEVVMHAALFSAMSPSVGVPYQEYAYSHLVDLMNKGMNPMVPGGVTPEHRTEFMSRVLPGVNKYPEHENEHWKGPAGNSIRTGGKKPDAKGVKEGNTGGLFGPDSKFASVVDYHHLHSHLMDMVNRHGSNVAAITSELLQHKNNARLFNARKKNKDAGVDYQSEGHGPAVDGFANKTVRYLLGMMGGGNIHVPDTHYIRHTFNLPQDDEIISQVQQELGDKWDPSKHIGYAPNDALKGILWKAHNHEIGEAMDRYYAKHHPAAKHVRERHFSKPDADGFQWDDDAHVFPAFWKHWLSIEPHEQSQGKKTDHQNAGTDHRVYWNAVNAVLKKYGLPHNDMIKSEGGKSIHERAAAAHAHMNRMFGDNAANFFYYHSIVPVLLRQASARAIARTPEVMIRKFESLAISLRSQMALIKAAPAKKPKSPKAKAALAEVERLKAEKAARDGKAHFNVAGDTAKAKRDQIHEKEELRQKDFQAEHDWDDRIRDRRLARQAPRAEQINPPKDDFGNTIDVQSHVEGKEIATNPRQIDTAAPEDNGDGQLALPLPLENRVKFNNREVEPGLVEGIAPRIKGQKFHLLHQDNNHVVVVPEEEGLDGARRKWRAEYLGTHFVVHKPVKRLDVSPMVIDHDKHGYAEFHKTPEQRDLIHGTDLTEDSVGAGEGGVNSEFSHWRKMANGKTAYIKADPQRADGFGHTPNDENISEPLREALYTNLARRMGLGDHVPNVAAFRHPETGLDHAAIERVDAEHYYGGSEQNGVLNHYGRNGTLDKLALMNMLLGNHDRHGMNWMLSHDKGPIMIDHGLAFLPARAGASRTPPDYWQKYHRLAEPNKYWRELPLHPEAGKWIDSLKHEDLMNELQHAPDRYKQEVGARLKALKQLRATFGDSLPKGHAFVHPQGTEE